MPDALPSGFSLTQALCQDPYPGSPTAVQALKVDFHHGSHASPRYRCFIVWLFPFQECLFTCDRFYPLIDYCFAVDFRPSLIVISEAFSLLYYLDSFCLEQFYACSEYILLCVNVTVMQCSAFRANPLPDRQVLHVYIFMSATSASLGRWVPSADLAKIFSGTFHFIFYHAQELRPANRGN